MDVFLALFTYFAYCFIIVGYTLKIIKYLKFPVHLRWDLYPVIHDEAHCYGGSSFEKKEWWNEPHKRRNIKGFFWLLKGYFTLDDYFRRNFFYWLGLYPWHIGFILIITFHALCFFGALSMVFGVTVSSDTTNITGKALYYGIILTGVVSFIMGAIGSILILLNRSMDENMRKYSSPMNYFMYLFTLTVFLSGLYSWYLFDPDMEEYRKFWVGLITFNFVEVQFHTALHITLFNLFLIYLPFTRSLHYITRFFSFFLIRWDDEPNTRGGILEKKIVEQLSKNLTWAGEHINTGKKWIEQ